MSISVKEHVLKILFLINRITERKVVMSCRIFEKKTHVPALYIMIFMFPIYDDIGNISFFHL